MTHPKYTAIEYRLERTLSEHGAILGDSTIVREIMHDNDIQTIDLYTQGTNTLRDKLLTYADRTASDIIYIDDNISSTNYCHSVGITDPMQYICEDLGAIPPNEIKDIDIAYILAHYLHYTEALESDICRLLDDIDNTVYRWEQSYSPALFA